ncbi:hypothetical protein BV20DRAFT_973402 [Pilatotrama ljubarskyi]|nr:hypothetical protein BV20DRAFT_973402 [Pilatotrama ljubarskyi]
MAHFELITRNPCDGFFCLKTASISGADTCHHISPQARPGPYERQEKIEDKHQLCIAVRVDDATASPAYKRARTASSHTLA